MIYIGLNKCNIPKKLVMHEQLVIIKEKQYLIIYQKFKYYYSSYIPETCDSIEKKKQTAVNNSMGYKLNKYYNLIVSVNIPQGVFYHFDRYILIDW